MDGVQRDLLEEGEDRFRAMADNAPVLMWIAGPDAQAIFFNASWLRFSGRTLAQELGTGWLEGVHPEDRQRCMGTYLAAFFARRSFETEYRLRRHDGEYRWMVDSGAPRIGPGGEFTGYVGSCIDITPRRWAQQELARVNSQLQAVLDASHQVAIIATDPEGEITLFNRGAEAMLGKPAAEVLGRVCTQLARDLPEFAARRERLTAEFGRPIDGWDVLALRARLYEHDEQEWTIYRENGRITINLVASPMRGADGEITGYVAIGRDITDSKAAEVALRESAYRVQGALHGSMDAIVMMVAIRDDAGVLVEPEEQALAAALEAARRDIDAALVEEDYGRAMGALAGLRQPVDGFFTAVMVNVPQPELRLNRLLLLSRIRSALQQVADFSLLEDAPRGERAE